MVGRFHQQLKVGLATHTADWPLKLPLVLLGLCAAVKEDLATFPSQLTYGTALRLPGEFINPMGPKESTDQLVEKLTERFDAVRALPPRQQGQQSSFIPSDLNQCSHVFIHVNAVKKSLQPPYEDPF